MDCEELEVTIDNIVFQAADDRFCVFKASSKGTGTFTATCKGPAPFVGEVVKLTGAWTEHVRFGRQFQVQSWKSQKPTDQAGNTTRWKAGKPKFQAERQFSCCSST